MKKKVFKKLMCAVLTAVCVVTSVVPTFAEDTVTATEAATTKSVTSAYKYHLRTYDYKKNDWITFSKTSFYKDLNALPSVGTGKTTINVPALPGNAKSIYRNNKERERYESYVKFKAPATGTYVFTLSNLNGTSQSAVRAMTHYGVYTPKKIGKRYQLDNIGYVVSGEYDMLHENNYLEKLRSLMDAFAAEHPGYETVLDNDYTDEEDFMLKYPTSKIQCKSTLKKGKTYILVFDNSGMTTLSAPYNNSPTVINSKSCLRGGIYTSAYSFDMEIKLKTKKK